VYNKIMKIKKEGTKMRQEVGTVACVVKDRRVFVSVERGAIPELDGKFISRHVMLKLDDEELPGVVRR